MTGHTPARQVKCGAVISHDISYPPSWKYVDFNAEEKSDNLEVYSFGMLG